MTPISTLLPTATRQLGLVQQPSSSQLVLGRNLGKEGDQGNLVGQKTTSPFFQCFSPRRGAGQVPGVPWARLLARTGSGTPRALWTPSFPGCSCDPSLWPALPQCIISSRRAFSLFGDNLLQWGLVLETTNVQLMRPCLGAIGNFC